MGDINPDHYKYMPHSTEESPEGQRQAETEETAAEETAAVRDQAPDNGSFSEETEPEKELHNTESHDAGYELKKEPEEESAAFSSIRNSVLAGFIYNIFSPFFIPTVATLLIFLLSLLAVVAPGAVTPYALTVFGATFLLPVLTIFVLQKIGIIQTFQLSDRSDRLVPYVIEFLALGAMAIFFIVKGASPWIWTIFCGGAAIALANFALNFKWRVSNHCSAIAALLAVIIVIQTYGLPQRPLFWWAIGASLFTGIIGSLAIIKGRHTLWEVVLGYATGFLGIILFSLIH